MRLFHYLKQVMTQRPPKVDLDRVAGSPLYLIALLEIFKFRRLSPAFACLVSFILPICGLAETRPSESFYVRNDPNNEDKPAPTKPPYDRTSVPVTPDITAGL